MGDGMTLTHNENVQPDEERCITPNCGKKAEWKHLCRSCYVQSRRLWEELHEIILKKKREMSEPIEKETAKQDPELSILDS